MLHVALYQPEIAPNTGNIIRLCANTGATLHLIHPLGFALDDRRLRRAGLDYHEYAEIQQHADPDAFWEWSAGYPVFGFSTRGQRDYAECPFEAGSVLLFGSETRGLPAAVRARLGHRLLRIPMRPNSRSLNLSNAVAAIVYEAWRQQGFVGAAK